MDFITLDNFQVHFRPHSRSPADVGQAAEARALRASTEGLALPATAFDVPDPDSVLGSGAFGTVYRGTVSLQPSICAVPAAIKVIEGDASLEDRGAFLSIALRGSTDGSPPASNTAGLVSPAYMYRREVSTHRSSASAHVVRLLGHCVVPDVCEFVSGFPGADGDIRPGLLLATELMDCSLETLLHAPHRMRRPAAELCPTAASRFEELQQGSPLLWTEIISIVWQVAAGLRDIHDTRVFHGDIKPANVLVRFTSCFPRPNEDDNSERADDFDVDDDEPSLQNGGYLLPPWFGTPLRRDDGGGADVISSSSSSDEGGFAAPSPSPAKRRRGWLGITVKIADFGLAHALREPTTAELLGEGGPTPAPAAGQSAAGSSGGKPADVYCNPSSSLPASVSTAATSSSGSGRSGTTAGATTASAALNASVASDGLRQQGTIIYLDPEVLASDDCDPRSLITYASYLTPASDMYALAVTAYETLTRLTPFPRFTRSQLVDAIRAGAEDWAPPAEGLPDLGPGPSGNDADSDDPRVVGLRAVVRCMNRCWRYSKARRANSADAVNILQQGVSDAWRLMTYQRMTLPWMVQGGAPASGTGAASEATDAAAPSDTDAQSALQATATVAGAGAASALPSVTAGEPPVGHGAATASSVMPATSTGISSGTASGARSRIQALVSEADQWVRSGHLAEGDGFAAEASRDYARAHDLYLTALTDTGRVLSANPSRHPFSMRVSLKLVPLVRALRGPQAALGKATELLAILDRWAQRGVLSSDDLRLAQMSAHLAKGRCLHALGRLEEAYLAIYDGFRLASGDESSGEGAAAAPARVPCAGEREAGRALFQMMRILDEDERMPEGFHGARCVCCPRDHDGFR